MILDETDLDTPFIGSMSGNKPQYDTFDVQDSPHVQGKKIKNSIFLIYILNLNL
jgi:hypothetical protein